MKTEIMMKRLTEYGADLTAIKSRFTDDAEFYYICLKMFFEEPHFDELDKHVSEKDYEKAFLDAHNIKGACGNMALTPLYDAVCELVELLRAKKFDGVPQSHEKVKEQLKIAKKLIEE